MSDALGRKLLLNSTILLFAVGSIVFSVSKSMDVMILGRVLQGLGRGCVDGLSEVIVADVTTLKERPLYMGLLAVPVAVGRILGPALGALFSELADWLDQSTSDCLFCALIGLAIGPTTFNGMFASAVKDLETLPESIAALIDSNAAIAFIPFLRNAEVPAI
ncbi:putative MFS transporter [Seiridium cardinale]